MLQNRVDPLGNLIKTSARGAWMGNRGILHDDHQQIRRAFVLKAWITCVLEFRGRKRQVMSPHRYTELFFLDEATSFSAGHRPCFECRRLDAERFKAAWIQGNPAYRFDKQTSIRLLDEVLHKERIGRSVASVRIKDLPDGSFVLYDEKPFLVSGGLAYIWSPFGYGQGIELPGAVGLLTPGSIVNAFRAGYVPQMRINQ